MANIYDMSDTWNDGATTFTSIKMSVTDTASASGSLLMDLQVGGASKLSVDKAGRLKAVKVWTLSDEPLTAELFALGSSDTQCIKGTTSSSQIGLNIGTKFFLGDKNSAFEMANGVALGWATSPGSGFTGGVLSGDLYLARDAANTLAQRNSTNAQAFNLYNTYTDASNYERGVFDFTSVANQLTIGTTKAGTGATRLVRFVVGGTRVAISDGSYFQIDKDLYPTENIIMAAKYTEMAEMTAPAAPAANKVRIYAEDNGSGKTRLMAVFPTGVAQQIAIEP